MDYASNDEGNCPYCDWDNEDEYIHIKTRQINEKLYETQKCTNCGKEFDRVYDIVFIKSQETLSTDVILDQK